MTKFLFNSIILFLLSGCASLTSRQDPRNINGLSQFEKSLVKTDEFVITTYQKINSNSSPYVFYIEGDGAIMRGRSIASDPTPRQGTLLKLMAMDQRPNIIYLARPCQFTNTKLNPKCTNNTYWTDKRLSEEVIGSLNQVINKTNSSQKFSLIGYSGGGAAALLIAARNKRVKDIITIVANIDTEAFVKHHKSRLMHGSLNPRDFIQQTKHIPQMHLSGEYDRIVPTDIAAKYIQKANSKCVKMQIIKGATHSKGWKGFWLDYNKAPICD
ncbi:MAG: hypothetical protein DGJ47_000074 [Rickettsiaceae bacterium]